MSDTQDIIGLANQQLNDIVGITYPPDTLISYLNFAILEIINLKPDAYPTTKNLDLIPGTIQSLPTGDISIIDVVCNMGVAGDTVGQTVTDLKKEQMDEIFPGWMTFPTSDVVSFIIIDSRNTQTFYTFPPQPDPVTQKLRAVVVTPPTLMETTDDTFPLDASFKPACVDYLVYRALAEETTVPNALAKSQMFWNKFLQDLGLKSNAEKATEVKGQ